MPCTLFWWLIKHNLVLFTQQRDIKLLQYSEKENCAEFCRGYGNVYETVATIKGIYLLRDINKEKGALSKNEKGALSNIK